jgi:hypothetical protein
MRLIQTIIIGVTEVVFNFRSNFVQFSLIFSIYYDLECVGSTVTLLMEFLFWQTLLKIVGYVDMFKKIIQCMQYNV